MCVSCSLFYCQVLSTAEVLSGELFRGVCKKLLLAMEEIFFIKDGVGRRRGIESNLGGSSVENFFVLLF